MRIPCVHNREYAGTIGRKGTWHEQTQKQTRADTGVYVKSYAVSATKDNNIKALSPVGGGWQVEKGKYIFKCFRHGRCLYS